VSRRGTAAQNMPLTVFPAVPIHVPAALRLAVFGVFRQTRAVPVPAGNGSPLEMRVCVHVWSARFYSAAVKTTLS